MRIRFLQKLFGGLLVCAFIYIPVVMFRSETLSRRSGYFVETTAEVENNVTMANAVVTDMYDNTSNISCRNYGAIKWTNASVLPERLAENILPPKPFAKCGVNGLLTPNWDLQENVWMVFMVKSAPDHFMLRDSVRRTWATVSEMSGKKFITIFLLGKTKEGEQALLEEENQIYGDILQCDVEDSYYNLTNKVLSTFRWVLISGLQAEHYTFCDDDTVMHIANIYVYFNELKLRNITDTVVCGFIYHEHAKPERSKGNKWYMSEKLYNTAEYPTFCHGAMWTISLNVLRELYCVAEVTNAQEFYLDDVFLTGILRHKWNPSNTTIHDAALVKDLKDKDKEKSKLMYYIWGEGKNRFARIIVKWRTLQIYFETSEPLMRGSDVRIHPGQIKHRKPPSSNLRDKWIKLAPNKGSDSWVVCIFVLCAFVFPYGVFIFLFVFISRNSSEAELEEFVNEKKIRYEEIDREKIFLND